MLGKLLKYDLKAEYKKYSILYIVLIITSFLSLMTSKIIDNYPKNMAIEILQTLLLTAVSILSFAIIIITIGFSIGRFYKNLLKDEGYLMHTLPVSTSQLILSKFIAFYIWIIASTAAVFLAISIISGGFDWLIKFGQEFSTGFAGLDTQDFHKFTACLIILLAVSPLALMAQVYLSCALGQLSNKNKLAMSVVAFVAIYVAQQIISTLAAPLLIHNFSFEYNSDVGVTPETVEAFSKFADFMLIGVVFTVLLTAAMYIVSNVILTKKLNLE